ncbi:unnamed protein product, partial [Ectocarpus sp. 12 AP-2014]
SGTRRGTRPPEGPAATRPARRIRTGGPCCGRPPRPCPRPFGNRSPDRCCRAREPSLPGSSEGSGCRCSERSGFRCAGRPCRWLRLRRKRPLAPPVAPGPGRRAS